MSERTQIIRFTAAEVEFCIKQATQGRGERARFSAGTMADRLTDLVTIKLSRETAAYRIPDIGSTTEAIRGQDEWARRHEAGTTK
jgi:hypothetical protein